MRKILDTIKQRAANVQTRPDWMTRKPQAAKTTKAGLEWVRIIPYAGNKQQADKLPSKLGGMGGTVVWRFAKDSQGKISILAAYSSAKTLRNALRQRLPHTDLQTVDAPQDYEFATVKRVGDPGGILSDSGNLAAILDALEPESYIELTFDQRPEQEYRAALRSGSGRQATQSGNRLNDAAEAWKEILGISGGKSINKPNSKSDTTGTDKDTSKRVDALLSESTNYFSVSITIGAKHANHRQAIFVEVNNQMKKTHHLSLNASAREILWREPELAVLVAVPDMTNTQMQRAVTHLKPGERTLDDEALTDGVAVGRLIHPTKPKRLVMIPLKQFLKHYFLSGKNGSGKSSTAVQMIQSMLDVWAADPANASGFTYIDPAGSTLTIILNRLLHMEQQGATIPWDKVHYIDLTPDSEYPMGLNLLYRMPHEDISNVAGQALDVIKSAFGGDAIFTERLLENALSTLLYDTRRTHTMLGVLSVLQYPAMRAAIKIGDPMVEDFWKTTGDDLKPKDLDPLQNRLRPFLSNPAMRRIFGQAKWTLNIRQWMDDGHIILVNVKNLEPRNMGIVGGQILTRYHVIAKTRPEDISKPHMLMIDEAHNVQIPILGKVVAEDRKFGLSLGLITQYPEQFSPEIRKAISENMGTFLSCTAGPDSAGFIAKMVNNAFKPEDIQGLPSNTVAAYTTIDDKPFSFMVKSDPPIIYMRNGKAANYTKREEQGAAQDWAIEKARELAARDGSDRDAVDREIAEYFEWLKQFREDDGEDTLPANIYKPVKGEHAILDAIKALVGDRVEWEGTTSELLVALAEYTDTDDYKAAALGKLMSKAESWLDAQNINAESRDTRKGTVWRLFLG